MARKTVIEKAERRVLGATSLFKQAHDEVEQANEELRQAQDFHGQEARRHAEHAKTARERQVANAKVLETLRALIPGEVSTRGKDSHPVYAQKEG